MVEFEADDALATAAARFHKSAGVEQVLICSPDKDLAQCVRGSRVACFDRMRRRILDEPAVIAKFGVSPESIPDWLALVGDDADGIPGVPRWGSKSAAALLARYEHLEAIPDDEAQWGVAVRGAASLAESLREHREDAALYRLLATLRTDVPLVEEIEDLRWRGALLPELDQPVPRDRRRALRRASASLAGVSPDRTRWSSDRATGAAGGSRWVGPRATVECTIGPVPRIPSVGPGQHRGAVSHAPGRSPGLVQAHGRRARRATDRPV